MSMNCDSKIPLEGKKIILEGEADLFTVSQLKPLYNDVQQIMFSNENNQKPGVGVIFTGNHKENIGIIINFIEGKPNLETIKIKVQGTIGIQKTYSGALLDNGGSLEKDSCSPFFLLNVEKVIDVKVGKERNLNYETNLQDLFPIGTPKYLELKRILQEALNDDRVGEDRPIYISGGEDITGDNMGEYLVNTGTGGATMDLYSVVLMKDGKPVVAKIKDKNGRVDYFQDMGGGGGSGRYGGDVVLVPKDQIGNDTSGDMGIVVNRFSIYNTADDYCESNFYRWNPQTEVFEYNKNLSDQMFVKTDLQAYCDNVKKQLFIEQ